VILDGINGCGKSTVAEALTRELASAGIVTARYHDPGSTPAGEAIRAIVRDPKLPMSAVAQTLLFTAARHEMAGCVRDQVEQGRWVVIDRWWYSTYAYQSAQGVDPSFIISLNARVAHLPDPVVAYYLDVPVCIALARRAEMRGDTNDRFEAKEEEFQEKLRERYLELCDSKHMIKVDAATHTARALARYLYEDLTTIEMPAWALKTGRPV
jgi:dTMP kinase